MKTTKMQLASFAIRIIKEVARSPKHIGIDYSTRQCVNVWFYKDENGNILKHFSLYGFASIRENIKIYRQIIKEIRR
jgi:hypothetical protein